MARPKKHRRVCSMPGTDRFRPEHCENDTSVSMTVEEYETLRLIDYMEMTQEECSTYMQVARTTVQQIYNDARKKTATALVEGRPLIIAGGNYTLCDGSGCGRNGCSCGCDGCLRHACRCTPKRKEE